jgi:ABC-type multidrug transport system fused ATPase/permease subunit
MTFTSKLGTSSYRPLLAIFREMLGTHPLLFANFLVLVTAAALTEGLGVSLLIPLLNGADIGTATRIPFVDEVLATALPVDPKNRVTALVALLAGIILARGALQVVSSYLSILLPLKVQARLSEASYDTMLNIGLDFFARADAGVLRTFVQEYPQRIAGSIKSVTDAIANGLLAAIYVGIMLSLSSTMTLSALVFVGVAGIVFKRVLMLPLHRVGVALSEKQERWNTLIHETGVGLKLIRLLGAEGLMRSSLRDIIRQYFRFDAMRQLISEAQSPLITTMGGLLVCGLFYYGSVTNSGPATAQLLVLVLCLYRLTAPVSRILADFVVIDTNLDALRRQEEICTTFGSRMRDGDRPFGGLCHAVELRDVTFCYPSSSKPALTKFNFALRRGEMVALVGPSGAGKSSVVNLLGRLYDPQQGHVMIDTRDIRDYRIGDWRRRIAIVSQDITLFNMSVADNLTFGLQGMGQDQLVRAVEQAAAADFIRELPQGWATQLGDRGTRLSGGQQQRLSIARAILRDPDLLILDEATSQLDSVTELVIQKLIEDNRGHRSIIVVAHRLSTIRRADRIVVMRDGEVIETGTHQELSRASSHYRRMLDAQQLDILVDAPQEAMVDL